MRRSDALGLDLRRHFSRFLHADPDRIHLAAHSHHFWPDVTFDAQVQAWQDAARLADEKWGPIFSDLIPTLQAGVAEILRLPNPATIAVAPNTHEFLKRILSALPLGRPGRVLTTDGEFHSLSRQLARLEEDGQVSVDRVPVDPSATFASRFAEACAQGDHDLIYVSQVFFNSGATCGDLEQFVSSVPNEQTLVVVDGYHGFMALPTDLSAVADRVFYVAGGYKYAMAGEGACFMHCPPGYAPRPRDTGWFAAFGALTARQDGVPYGEDGSRFLGATFDPSGLYRLRAVLQWKRHIGLTVESIHDHVLDLQRRFVERATRDIPPLREARLVTPVDDSQHGHFLTYETPVAADLHRIFLEQRVVTDVRGDRIRFGFGCYHVQEDVDRAFEAMASALARSQG